MSESIFQPHQSRYRPSKSKVEPTVDGGNATFNQLRNDALPVVRVLVSGQESAQCGGVRDGAVGKLQTKWGCYLDIK